MFGKKRRWLTTDIWQLCGLTIVTKSTAENTAITKEWTTFNWIAEDCLIIEVCIGVCFLFRTVCPIAKTIKTKSYTQQWGLCSFEALQGCNRETNWMMAVKQAKRGIDLEQHRLNSRASPVPRSTLHCSAMHINHTLWPSHSIIASPLHLCSLRFIVLENWSSKSEEVSVPNGCETLL